MKLKLFLQIKRLFTCFFYIQGLSIPITLIVLSFACLYLIQKPSLKEAFEPVEKEMNLAGLEKTTTLDAFSKHLIDNKICFFLSKENRGLFGIVDSGEFAEFVYGEKVYLDLEERISLTSKATDLFFLIEAISDDTVRGTLCFQKGEVINQVAFTKLIDNEALDRFIPEKEAIKRLKEAEFFHEDKLFEYLFPTKKRNQRLFFPDQSKWINLSECKELHYRNGVWSDQLSNRDEYRASIIEKKEGEIVFFAYEVDGLYQKEVKIEQKKTGHEGFFEDLKMTHVRQRGPQVISCRIGKQNSLLKKGDWLIKTSSYWKPLKTEEEREKFLTHKIQGELFIFEGISLKEGAIEIKGALFDKNREKMRGVSERVFSSVKKRENKRVGRDQIKMQTHRYNDTNDELLKLAGSTRYNEIP